MAMQEELEVQGNFLFKYRGTLPLIILVFALAFFIFNQYTSKANPFELSNAYISLCLGISMLGLIIRIYTVGHTPRNTSGRNTKEQLADKLNTSGIYSTLRHPLYLGNFFMWFGIGMLTGSLAFNIIFFLFYWIYYERIMFAEEQFLRRKFAAEYLKWAERTPAIIPSFKNWQKPNLPFSLKKVIKKEKNGLVAVFILIFVFDRLNLNFHNFEAIYDLNIWFYAMIGSIIAYIAIKIINKSTNTFKNI